jgi:hypothetical protein
MTMKKLAIVSAIAMMSMGSVYAQQTTVTTTNAATTAETGGLMTTLSNSLGNLFQNNETVAAVVGQAGTPDTYAAWASTASGSLKYVLDANGTYRPATADELATPPAIGYFARTAGTPFIASAAQRLANPVDITALAGAVNLSAINGGINITGVNVSLSGLANVGATATTGLSTTVIGAMNSSTLDISKSLTTLSDMTKSTLDMASLAAQDGIAPSINTQSFGPGQLDLSTVGSTILGGGNDSQFNMTGLVSGTETLASSTTDKLQNMNVFNMAVNMAPLIAGVNIAATVDTNAWFLGPQTGVVNLSGLSVATTAIGAMNSSITSLGAKLK